MNYILSCLCPFKRRDGLTILDQTTGEITDYRGGATRVKNVDLIRSTSSKYIYISRESPCRSYRVHIDISRRGTDGKTHHGVIEDISLEFHIGSDMDEMGLKRLIHKISTVRFELHMGGANVLSVKMSDLMVMSCLIGQTDSGYEFIENDEYRSKQYIKIHVNLPFYVNKLSHESARIMNIDVSIDGDFDKMNLVDDGLSYCAVNTTYLSPMGDVCDKLNSINDAPELGYIGGIGPQGFSMVQCVNLINDIGVAFYNAVSGDVISYSYHNIRGLMVMIEHSPEVSDEDIKHSPPLPYIESIETDNHLSLVNMDNKKIDGLRGMRVYVYSCDPDYEDDGFIKWFMENIELNDDPLDLIRGDIAEDYEKVIDKARPFKGETGIKIKLSRSYADYRIRIVPMCNRFLCYGRGVSYIANSNRNEPYYTPLPTSPRDLV